MSPDTIRNNKIITNAQMIGIGAVNILDTYLSPEKYRGTELRYISHTLRERRDSRWSRLIVHQGNMSYSDNRSGNGGEIAGAYTFSYGVHYNWNFFDGSLNVKAGAQADVNVGFLYNTRNSNNPAQARLSLNISPSAAATYRFRLWQHNYSLRYELSVPLIGMMFSPKLRTVVLRDFQPRQLRPQHRAYHLRQHAVAAPDAHLRLLARPHHPAPWLHGRLPAGQGEQPEISFLL